MKFYDEKQVKQMVSDNTMEVLSEVLTFTPLERFFYGLGFYTNSWLLLLIGLFSILAIPSWIKDIRFGFHSEPKVIEVIKEMSELHGNEFVRITVSPTNVVSYQVTTMNRGAFSGYVVKSQDRDIVFVYDEFDRENNTKDQEITIEGRTSEFDRFDEEWDIGDLSVDLRKAIASSATLDEEALAIKHGDLPRWDWFYLGIGFGLFIISIHFWKSVIRGSIYLLSEDTFKNKLLSDVKKQK